MAECNTAVAQIDLTKVKPYGDTLNDGMTEVAFTLPVPYGDEANEAAKMLAKKMGLDEPNVVYAKEMTKEYTFFVVYGKCQHTVDYTTIKVAKVDVDVMDRLECAEYIKENIGRGTRAFRVGGDEIVVIQKNANEASVQELIEHIYESIEYKNKMSKVKISVASGYCIGAGKEIEKVIAEADARMYVEKKRIKEEQKRIKLINVTNGAEELK